MLPDWPDPKEEILHAFMRHTAERVRQRSIAGMVVAVPVHEGYGHFIERADGTTEERLFERTGAELAIPADAITSESLADMLGRMQPVIESLASATSQTMLNVMEEGIRAVGNEIEAGGRPISAELVLEALERVQMDFNQEGRPQWPTIMIHPSQEARLTAELARIDADPELRQRGEALLVRKREEWRDREASRILAG
jgi:Ser/Thr protein kinase RdoA (MazF antagonist)